MTNNQKGVLYACITTLFWGFLAIFLEIAIQRVDAPTIVWFRFCVAFILLLIWKLLHKPQELKVLVRPPWALFFAAVALSLNYFGFILSVHYTSPSNAQLLSQIGTLSLALTGIIFFRERLSRIQLFGFILAVAGLFLFYSQQIRMLVGSTGQRYNIGVLFAIGAALTWTVYAVFQKILSRTYSSSSLNLFIFGFPAIAYLPFVHFHLFAALNAAWWGLLIFLGLNTLIAYGALAQALRYADSNKVSVILLMVPMITMGAMAGIAWFHVSWISSEHFSSLSLVGAAVVIVGAVFVTRKQRQTKILGSDSPRAAENDS